jgi:hypothetical protein
MLIFISSQLLEKLPMFPPIVSMSFLDYKTSALTCQGHVAKWTTEGRTIAPVLSNIS